MKKQKERVLIEKRIAEINSEVEKIIKASVCNFKDPLIQGNISDPILLMKVLSSKYKYLHFSLSGDHFSPLGASKDIYSLFATPFCSPFLLKKEELYPDSFLEIIEQKVKHIIIPDFNMVSIYACGVDAGIDNSKRTIPFRMMPNWLF